MEMIMSAISNSLAQREALAATALRGVGRALRTWWTAYMNWRLEQLAIKTLQSMSDRELRDMGVSRSAIAFAVKGGTESHPIFSRYY
jgi:uncharacterized protein YjiS (DUF1127 family)